MEGLDPQTIIAVMASLAVLLTGFNSLLNAKIGPLKENQSRFDNELKELKAGQAKLSADIAEIKQLLANKI